MTTHPTVGEAPRVTPLVSLEKDYARTFTSGERGAIGDRYQSALWYAWGHIDSGRYTHLTLEDGWRFAYGVHVNAEKFYRQECVGMKSLMDYWARYVTIYDTPTITDTTEEN